jgi:hypothetical protein
MMGRAGAGYRGIFVAVKTLIGEGGGAVGLHDGGRMLVEYILDAIKEQLWAELGKNVSLYPAELLADRFMTRDQERYRKDLAKFLRDPNYFDEEETEEVDEFLLAIQQDRNPEHKRSCGDKLWRFYTEYLKVRPDIEAETEDVLAHTVEAVLAEGYRGILLVLDEVSLFMKNREERLRTEDEKTLAVLSNRLAKVRNLPVWTVCAAQQAIESKMGAKNIIANDRLKLVKLLEEDKDYYEIVLARVREIKDPAAVGPYFLHYKKGFSWPNSVGETAFREFFPFHKPAIEVLRAITYELTTARSAIHFMHQTLKRRIDEHGNEVIRLWEFFDDTVRYEEDPSGVYAGLADIKTKRDRDYRAYEACKRQINGMAKGPLKAHRDKAVKIIQTLFLYHIARTRQQGITPEDIANAVLIAKDDAEDPEENNDHYEFIADNLKKELRQIVQDFDDERRPRYRFDPVFTGVDPRKEFVKAKDEAESNEAMRKEAWEHLLALDEWPVRTRQMTIDLSGGLKSTFREIAPFSPPWADKAAARSGERRMDVVWNGRQVSGRVEMRDLGRMLAENQPLPPIESDRTDLDFAVYIGTRHTPDSTALTLLERRKDPRVIVWTPAELTQEERDRLVEFAAYRKLVADWQGKDGEDAVATLNWVSSALNDDLARIAKIVDNSYARGRVDALDNTGMKVNMAGELPAILTPLAARVLSSAYESADVTFPPQYVFRKEEGVKVINGIVRKGFIPKGAKPDQHVSAARNFGPGLGVMKPGAEERLDVSGNAYVQALWDFIDDNLTGPGHTMKMGALYKNFMGIGGPKDFGLTRRMVQIYLLCLVREGRVRVAVAPKAGLPFPVIDYSNIEEVEFSTKILDGLTEVQKTEKPENWEVLRPYAEKLLGREIPDSHEDAVIAAHRAALREWFAQERESSSRVLDRAGSLFAALDIENPYRRELEQIAKLCAHNVEGGDDIQLVLYALKDALGYGAYDTGRADQQEVDDLAYRMKVQRDVRSFLEYERELRAARAYCAFPMGDLPELTEARRAVEGVRGKLLRVKDYIDSEVLLKTEFVGAHPPTDGRRDTVEAMIREYSAVYLLMHDSVVNLIDGFRKTIDDMIKGEEIKALRILDGIEAIRGASAQHAVVGLEKLRDGIFECPSPSRASVETALRETPVHECGLTFDNAEEHFEAASKAARDAAALIDEAFRTKAAVLLTPAVRERLEQGKAEPAVAGLLECRTSDEIRRYLVHAALEDPGIVPVINRYLKRVVVKRVKVADFRPAMRSVEKDQVEEVTKEFRRFLEDRFAGCEEDGDSVVMLEFE